MEFQQNILSHIVSLEIWQEFGLFKSNVKIISGYLAWL